MDQLSGGFVISQQVENHFQISHTRADGHELAGKDHRGKGCPLAQTPCGLLQKILVLSEKQTLQFACPVQKQIVRQRVSGSPSTSGLELRFDGDSYAAFR